MFGLEGPRGDVLARSMEIIGREGSGIVVILAQRTEDNDLLSRLIQHHAGQPQPGMDELRDYGVGAQILADLGVHDMVLLTNSHHSLIALDGYDLAVVGERPVEL
jgi:3,4-dihydroxy 2-butanone 4-phosphate synthase/GTP cyclohydrolase II